MKESRLRKRIKARRREEAKAAGYYDGRFAHKVFKNKKKEKNKYLCRKKIKFNPNED